MSKKCEHVIVPGRKPGTEKCKLCTWRYPCPEDTCAHSDCIEFKQALPRCYYCEKRVAGSPANFSVPGSVVPELTKNDDQEATWMRQAVWGATRAVHIKCYEEKRSE